MSCWEELEDWWTSPMGHWLMWDTSAPVHLSFLLQHNPPHLWLPASSGVTVQLLWLDSCRVLHLIWKHFGAADVHRPLTQWRGRPCRTQRGRKWWWRSICRSESPGFPQSRDGSDSPGSRHQLKESEEEEVKRKQVNFWRSNHLSITWMASWAEASGLVCFATIYKSSSSVMEWWDTVPEPFGSFQLVIIPRFQPPDLPEMEMLTESLVPPSSPSHQ